MSIPFNETQGYGSVSNCIRGTQWSFLRESEKRLCGPSSQRDHAATKERTFASLLRRFAHNQNGAPRVPRDKLCNTSQEEFSQPFLTMGTEDDQVRAPFFGCA
jgi:hypothetical protein